tara:strand:+ start:673 stop:2553 length:1881 start_codon:yes stop_codon:yes gene_type:complete
MNVKDITKALSTEFRPGDPEHFRLGVWHDGDTLENSTIKISRDLDDPTKTFIDILDKKGTGKGTVSDITKLKKKFNEIRKYLPPGDYELNADHPTKAKMYIRDFLNEPGFEMSGEKGAAKVLNKKTGKLEHKQFDTLIMKVPGVTDKLKEDVTDLVRSEYKKLGLSPNDKTAISGLRKSPAIQKLLKDNNVNIESINQFVRDGGIENEKKLLSVKPAGQSKPSNRPKTEVRPGQKVKKGSPLKGAIDELTERFKKGASYIDGHTPEKMQQYFDENAQLLNELKLKVRAHNLRLKNRGADISQAISRGHDARLSKSIDSPRNIFLELLTENVAKGDNYSASPGASLVTGNPVKEGVSPLKNWFDDYATWLDKAENGGTGVLAQRGDYSDLLEQHIRALGSEKWDKLTPTQKKLRLGAINDLITNTEKLNQWLPSEGAQRRQWGILSPDDAAQSLEIINDSELAGIRKGEKLTPEVGEYGRRLGGIGDDFTLPRKVLSNIGRVYTKIPGRKVAQKFLPPTISALLDTAGVIAANDQIQSETLNEKLAGMFHFGAGVTGLLGVAPTPLSPVLGKVSMGLTGAGLAAENPETVAEVVDELRPDLPLQEKGREQVKKNQETNPYASFAIGL